MMTGMRRRKSLLRFWESTWILEGCRFWKTHWILEISLDSRKRFSDSRLVLLLLKVPLSLFPNPYYIDSIDKSMFRNRYVCDPWYFLYMKSSEYIGFTLQVDDEYLYFDCWLC